MSRRGKQGPEGLSFDQFRRGIREGRMDPLYLLTGEEEYYHDRALKLLFDTVDEVVRSFNVSIFSIGESISGGGSKVTLASALDTANQVPMISARRVVVIRDFMKLGEDETKQLRDYLKNPAPTAVVVFQASSLDQRRKITGALLDSCTVVALGRLAEPQIRRWAGEYLKRRGVKIDPQALERLIDLTGNRLSRVANELDKLINYSAGDRITTAVVEQLSPRSREHTSWELRDAVMNGDRGAAVRLVVRLLDDGAEPLMILGAIAMLYRRMVAAGDAMSRGASPAEAARLAGQSHFSGGAFIQSVRQTPRAALLRAIERIAETDDAIKNAEGTPRLQIERLIVELTLPHDGRWGIFH